MIDKFINDTLQTKEQLNSFLFRLEKFINVVNKKNFSRLLRKMFFTEEQAFLSYFITKDDDIQKKADRLKSKLEKIPVFTLHIPFYPSPKLIDRIIGFLRANDQVAVLEIKINPNLLAGAIVEFKGKMKDYSLKNFLEINNAV